MLTNLLRAACMTIATLGASWGAYQAARWGGVQARTFARASALRSESVRASNTALQLAQIDVTAFIAWAMERAQGNDKAALFLRQRFRPEFVPAFDSWLASAREAGATPEGTPFSRTEYQPAARAQADRLLHEAETSAVEGQKANQISDNFMFAVVLFGTVAFLAGVKVDEKTPRAMRIFLAGIAAAMLLCTTIFMLRLPQQVGF